MIIDEFWRLMLLIIGKYQYVVQCVRCKSSHEDYSHNCSQLEIRFIMNNAYVIIEKAHIPLCWSFFIWYVGYSYLKSTPCFFFSLIHQ